MSCFPAATRGVSTHTGSFSLRALVKGAATCVGCAREPASKYGFHNRGDYQERARADHHDAPGDHSPLEARYIFADCFSSNPISLAVRRRTIHISLTRNRWSNSQDSFSTDWEKARAAVWNRAPADEPAFLPKRQLPTNKAEAGPERGCMAFRSPLVTLRRPRRTENIQAGTRA